MIEKIAKNIVDYAVYHGYDDLHYENIDLSLTDDEGNIIKFKLEGSKFDPFVDTEDEEKDYVFDENKIPKESNHKHKH